MSKRPHTSSAAGAASPARPASLPPGNAPVAEDLAYRDAPSERERREHRRARRDEQAALARLYPPRRHLVEVAPRACPIHDDGPGTCPPEAA